ncbi:MAG: RNB domain-containing ribonuclease [Rhodocyclaceae bacterium]|nr:RNB domain-containing ribonuclease [Rhodocyclaceae bacterium]
MYILFEEDGAHRAGTLLADHDSSVSVELPSGKRSKVKAGNVLMRFESPVADTLLADAATLADDIEIEFLWEVSADAEFGFQDLARDYHGRAPTALEATAILLRLHSAPIYFHRKGRGRFRRAPPDILRAALAGQEKKRQQQLAMARMASELLAGRCPDEIAADLDRVLYRPDRNRLEVKALEAACTESGRSAPQLLIASGALASAYDYHLRAFLFEHFPRGTAFDAELLVPEPPVGLPRATVSAFSIDDAETTEIDDAFSVTPTEAGWRIGIHIAAPGLAFGPGTPAATAARARLSTVYFPGNKITMLPDALVGRYTLSAGSTPPALSLYLDIGRDLRILGHDTRVECVPIAANLRHHEIEDRVNASLAAGEAPDVPYGAELALLHELACVFEAGRGKPSARAGLYDYNFAVDWSRSGADGPGLVSITRRTRGAPLDKLVAELMIFANHTWGAALAEAGIAALYRAQTAGKARMTSVPAAHEGLGVEPYAWCTSPLRRYVDLLNQWQLLAWLAGEAPPFERRGEDFLAALSDFEQTYAAYAEFQRRMERYWCLRYLRQMAWQELDAVVLRENLVRAIPLPLVFRCPSIPAGTAPGTGVRLAIESIDDLAIELGTRYLGIVPASVARGDTEIEAGGQ